MKSAAKKKPNKADPTLEQTPGIAALLAEQAKSIAHLSALVADGFNTTNASLARLEELLDVHAMATFEDFQELSGDLADLGDALDRLRDTTLRNDRILGDVEDAVNKIDGDYPVDKPNSGAYIPLITERELCHVGSESALLSR